MSNASASHSGRFVAPVFRDVVRMILGYSDGVKAKLWAIWHPVLFGNSQGSTVQEELDDENGIDELIKLHEQ